MHDANAASLLDESLDGAAWVDRDLARQRSRDLAEIDDAGLRRVQAGKAHGVRLDLSQLVAGEASQTGHAVLEAATVQLVEPPQLVVVRRNDELAAALDPDPVRLAEGVHQVGATPA